MVAGEAEVNVSDRLIADGAVWLPTVDGCGYLTLAGVPGVGSLLIQSQSSMGGRKQVDMLRLANGSLHPRELRPLTPCVRG